MSSGPPQPSTSNQDIVDNWLRQTYLRYTSEGNNELLEKQLTVRLEAFLNILKTKGRHSYFQEDVIDISLSLLTDIWKPSNCYVMSTDDAQLLSTFGYGWQSVSPTDVAHNTIMLDLQENSKRWIIIPCTDGMNPGNQKKLLEATNETQEKDGKGKKNKKENHREEAQQKKTTVERSKKDKYLGDGSHWGLMIIDTHKEEAKWLDSLVTLKFTKKAGEDIASIDQMLGAGRTAAKVLCGYEMLLGRDHGGYRAKTLKWLPHQRLDNTSGGRDEGACGPFLFACLKHIYEHPEALQNLYTHFDRHSTACGNFGRDKKGFNSWAIRNEIQDLIRITKERQESGNDLPLCLTPQIMNILGLKVSPQQLSQAITRFKTRSGPNNLEHVRGIAPVLPSDSTEKGSFNEDQQINNEVYKDAYEKAQKDGVLAALGNPTLAEFVQKYSSGLDSSQAATLKEHTTNEPLTNNPTKIYPVTEQPVKEGSKVMQEPPNQSSEGAGASSRVDSGTLKSGPNNSDSNTSGQLQKVIDGTTYNIPQIDKKVLKQPRNNRSKWPKGFTDLPDFSTIDNEGLKAWVQKTPWVRRDKESNENHNDYTSRAMLHYEYRRTFLTEPDQNFSTMWLHDTNVFVDGVDEDMPIDRIRHEVMKKYEPEILELIKPYAQKKRKSVEEHRSPVKKPRLIIHPPKYKIKFPPGSSQLTGQELRNAIKGNGSVLGSIGYPMEKDDEEDEEDATDDTGTPPMPPSK